MLTAYRCRFSYEALARGTTGMIRYGNRLPLPGWTSSKGGITQWELHKALTSSTCKLSARMITNTRHIVLDVDLHGEPPCGGAEQWSDPRGYARRWRARVLADLVARLRALGMVIHAVTRTARGLHLVILIARDVPVATAAGLALRLAAAAATEAPEGVTIEGFPKMRSDGKADHCSLPLTGPARWVSDDLTTVLHHRRLDAVEALLRLRGRAPRALDRIARKILPRGWSSTPRPVEAMPVSKTSAAAEGILYRADYVVENIRILSEPLRDDQFYRASMRVVFGGMACGHADEDTIAMAMVWLRRPGHEATHCQTERGLKEAERVIRSMVRRNARLVEREIFYRDGLGSVELRGLYDDLLREVYGIEQLRAA